MNNRPICVRGSETSHAIDMTNQSINDGPGVRSERDVSRSWHAECCVPITEVEWSDWSECSVTCGTGSQSRYSRCVDDGSRLELCMEAGGERTESRTCSREPCTAPDRFYPPVTNRSAPVSEQPGEHKHRKLHHSSAANGSDWVLTGK
jgi:hypothetical protein